MSRLLYAALAGVALGLQFNPLASAVGATLAAGLEGRPRGTKGFTAAAVAVIVAAWVVGDFLTARSAGIGAGAPVRYVVLGVQYVTSFSIGYALPAAAGIYVARRTIRGFGWPSAAFVALAISGALSVIAPRIGDVLWGLVPTSMLASLAVAGGWG
jgi:hypothetical protein